MFLFLTSGTSSHWVIFFLTGEWRLTHTTYIYVNVYYVRTGICGSCTITSQGRFSQLGLLRALPPWSSQGGDSSETISGRSVCTVKTRHENGGVLQPHGRRGSPSKLSSFKQQGSVALGRTEPLHVTSAEVTHAAVFGDTWLGPSFHKYPPQSVLSLLQDSPASL